MRRGRPLVYSGRHPADSRPALRPGLRVSDEGDGSADSAAAGGPHAAPAPRHSRTRPPPTTGPSDPGVIKVGPGGAGLLSNWRSDTTRTACTTGSTTAPGKGAPSRRRSSSFRSGTCTGPARAAWGRRRPRRPRPPPASRGQPPHHRRRAAGAPADHQAGEGPGQLGPGSWIARRPVDDGHDPARRHPDGRQRPHHAASECTPFIPGAPTATTTLECRTAAAGQMVALLHIGRTALCLALEVARHVGHDHLKRATQPVDAGVDGTGPQRAPRFRPAQTQQQPVTPPRHVEGDAPHLVDIGSPEPVGLDQLLGARAEVLGIVQHGLVGPPGQIGEHHPAPVAHVRGQPLRQGDGEGGGPGASRTANRDELAEPERGRDSPSAGGSWSPRPISWQWAVSTPSRSSRPKSPASSATIAEVGGGEAGASWPAHGDHGGQRRPGRVHHIPVERRLRRRRPAAPNGAGRTPTGPSPRRPRRI